MLCAPRLRRISVINNPGNRPPPRQTASALSEARCQCARRLFHVLTESWINGSFPTYDYSYTKYLFSAVLVLAISSLSKTSGSLGNGGGFAIAVQILSKLAKNGNFAAKEICRHMESIKTIFDQITLEECQVGRPHCLVKPRVQMMLFHTLRKKQACRLIHQQAADASSRLHLTEFLVEGLLSQLNLNLEILDPSMINDGFQQFMWPEEHYSSLVGN